jgi:hypothetical protein
LGDWGVDVNNLNSSYRTPMRMCTVSSWLRRGSSCVFVGNFGLHTSWETSLPTINFPRMNLLLSNSNVLLNRLESRSVVIDVTS